MSARRHPALLIALLGALSFVVSGLAHGQVATRPPTTTSSATTAPALRAGARVEGSVYDSLAMRPLRGALVQLVLANNPALARTATTDAEGTFRFDSVRTGTYLIGFFHARLDSVLFAPPMLRVEVVDSSTVEALLAIPSSRTMIARVCGPNAERDSTGLFAGSVRSALGGPINGKGRVRVQWTEVTLGARGLQRRTPSLLAQTNDNGEFAVCGVPMGSTLFARGFAGTDSSGYAEFSVPANGYLHRAIYVSTAERIASTDTSRPSLTTLRGPGTLRGTVRNGRGEGVPSARVSVWSTGQQTTTDRNGQYQLTSLPAGTFTLEARAIGFEIARRPVDIMAANGSPADVAMNATMRLDTVKVRGNRVAASRGMAEFESRRKKGFGYFIDEATIEKRQAFAVSDLLRLTPGIVVSSGNFGDQVLMRGNGMSAYCAPTLFLDGARTAVDDGALDAVVSPQEVRAVEVYSRAGSIPAEYQSINGCGVILIWTGTRGR